jgi:hypothetical protein
MCFPSPTIAGTAEPLRVSPPEAVVYPGEIRAGGLLKAKLHNYMKTKKF